MQTDENDEEPAAEPAQLGFLRRLEQRHGLSAMVALATFAALLVGLLAAIPDWREMLADEDPPPATIVSQVPPPSPAPVAEGLSAIDLVVRDPEKTGEPDDYEAPWTSPSVEITVHNRGTQRSVITRVVVTIEDSAVINICDTQGGALAVSATYDLTLPLQPAAGTVLRVPVSQQQGSDEADRFALKIGTPEREGPLTVHVYRLRFELEAGGEKTLPAGTAVVAVPLTPGEGAGYFWSAKYDDGVVVLPPGYERATPCMKENSATLKRLLPDGAELSPDLAEAKAVLRS